MKLSELWSKIYTPTVQRFVRVFLASFLVSLPIDRILMEPNSDVIESLIRSAVVAGISAVFKYWRDQLPADSRLQNFPL